MGLRQKDGKIFHGYWVLLGASLLHFLDSGIYFYGFSVFYTRALAESLRTFLLGSIVLHQIPHLVNIGIDAGTAAGVLGLMIFVSVPGLLIFGFLGDYIER